MIIYNLYLLKVSYLSSSAVQIVFFILNQNKSNIGPLFETEQNSFCHSQKSPLVSTCLVVSTVSGTMFAVCVVGNLLYSSRTWWAIVEMNQPSLMRKLIESRTFRAKLPPACKDLRRVSRRLLTTVLQTATFSY